MFINWDAADDKAAQLAARTFTSMTKAWLGHTLGCKALLSGFLKNLPHVMRIESNAAALDLCLALSLQLVIGLRRAASCRYTLMPRGDFITRNSFYEALCAGTIPVVVETDYFMHCAFSDVVDYRHFVTVLPEADFMNNSTRNAVQVLHGMHNETLAAGRIQHLWQVCLMYAFHCMLKQGLCAHF